MDKRQLVQIFLELRSASNSAKAANTEDSYMELIHKYDMVFGGEKFNIINSIELCHCLKTKFNFEISIDELNNVIPEICKPLNMKYEPLIDLKDSGNPDPPIAAYSISLY